MTEFSKLIRDAEHGKGLLITRRRHPIAELAPHMVNKTADPEWRAAYRRMMARLQEGVSLGGLRFEREELYDR